MPSHIAILQSHRHSLHCSHCSSKPHSSLGEPQAWEQQLICKLSAPLSALSFCPLTLPLSFPHPTCFSIRIQGLLTPRAVNFWLLLAAEVSIDRSGLDPRFIKQVPLPIHICRLPLRLLKELGTKRQEVISCLSVQTTLWPCPQ
jgi:hypothetical protein